MSKLRTTLPRTPSRKVMSLDQIEKYFDPMKELLEKIFVSNKGAVALHHCQMECEENFNFFVLGKQILFDKYDQYPIFINAKILEKDPKSKITQMEGCLSFPHRPHKKMPRYGSVFVQFEKPITDPNDPRKIVLAQYTQWFHGLMAKIFQHESEHAQGRHIY